MKFSIVSAYVNQLDMTRVFLNNLSGKIPEDTEVIMVNAGNKEKIRIDTNTYDYKRIDLKENHSFSNSMNAGIKVATGDYVVVMGNDGFPQTEDWLQKMEEVFKLYKDTYIATCNTDNPGKKFMAPYFIAKYGLFEEYNFVPAICWMVSRECIDTVGFLDEKFKIGNYEDNDYAIRVRKIGKRIILRDDVTITHLCSSESKDLTSKETNVFNQNYLKTKYNIK